MSKETGQRSVGPGLLEKNRRQNEQNQSSGLCSCSLFQSLEPPSLYELSTCYTDKYSLTLVLHTHLL